MALPTRSYEVIGEYKTPEDFVNNALEMTKTHSMIAITATEVSRDSLTVQRSSTPEEISFDLRMVEIRCPQDNEITVSGEMFINGVDQKQWILVETKIGKVLFKIISE